MADMTDEEARLYRLDYEQELRRIRALPLDHPGRWNMGGRRKASDRDLAYLEWLERKKARDAHMAELDALFG